METIKYGISNINQIWLMLLLEVGLESQLPHPSWVHGMCNPNPFKLVGSLKDRRYFCNFWAYLCTSQTLNQQLYFNFFKITTHAFRMQCSHLLFEQHGILYEGYNLWAKFVSNNILKLQLNACPHDDNGSLFQMKSIA